MNVRFNVRSGLITYECSLSRLSDTRYSLMFAFADTDADIHAHPPQQNTVGPCLYIFIVRQEVQERTSFRIRASDGGLHQRI